MGLNPRGRGRGRGGKGNFPNKSQRGGRMVGQGPMFRGGPPGMFCPPPMGFPPEPPFGGGPFFPGPSAFNFGPPRPGYGKFSRKNFKRRIQQKTETPLPEIDLTKPWVTEEIKTEDSKKQELLETWRKSKNDEDWSKYKSQKEIVKNLYDKAKEEYLANHQEEASYWQMVMATSGHKNYYCETCDKSFVSEDDLLWHEGEHETCGRDGCEFTAHPNIIAKHVKMQHKSGLFRRIGKLYTDEEIAKWIEERKKKYPTQKVIEDKKALESEKLKRGEKIAEEKSIFNKSFQKKSKNGFKTAEKIHRTRRFREKKKIKVVENAMEEENIANQRKIPCFRGIGGSDNKSEEVKNEADVDLAISDEEWDYQASDSQTSRPFINESLSLLASAYDSSDDNIGESESQKGNCLKEKEKDSLKNNDDDDGSPVEAKTVKKIEDQILENRFENTGPNTKRRKHFNPKNMVKRKKQINGSKENNFEDRDSTLLEKLLKKEIKHERNVILQCVHYVVINNFFNPNSEI